MLISKSQLHPVTIPAAAGGKSMATYPQNEVRSSVEHSPYLKLSTHKNDDNVGRLDHCEIWGMVEVDMKGALLCFVKVPYVIGIRFT
jgi:hypothetical protein